MPRLKKLPGETEKKPKRKYEQADPVLVDLLVLTVRQASRALQTSEVNIRRMAKNGVLPAVRFSDGRGARLRFRKEDLDAFLLSRRSADVA